MTQSSDATATFAAGKIRIADGYLHYKTKVMFFFYSKSKLPIQNIGTIRCSKPKFGNPWINIREFNVKQQGSTTTAEHSFQIPKEEFAPLLRAIAAQRTAPAFSTALQRVVCDNNVIEPSQLADAADALTSNNSSVWIYSDRVISDYNNSNALAIPSIHFVKQSGKETLWGYEARSSAEGLSATAYSAFKETLEKLGAAIGGDPGKVYNACSGWLDSIFKPRQESVILGAEGLTFEYSKKRKNESIYLPYVDIASMERKGKKLRIYGTQNIMSKRKFPSEARDAIRKKFEADAEQFTGSIMEGYFRLFGFIKLWTRASLGSIEYSNTGLLIHPSKADRKAGKKKTNRLIGHDLKIEMDNVVGYYQKGRKFVIAVNSGNVREKKGDQRAGNYNILYFKEMSDADDLASTLYSRCDNLVYDSSDMKDMLRSHKF